MARKPIWSRACCTSPPPHSHSALCTSHTHLLTISLCTPTFSQSYHLTLRSSTFSLPTFHTPSDTNNLIFSPYHSAQPPSHNLTLSVITHTLYNQYQHFHFSLSHSTHPPSHTLTLCTCNIHLLTISFFAQSTFSNLLPAIIVQMCPGPFIFRPPNSPPPFTVPT